MRKLPRRTAPNAKTARKVWENYRAKLRQTLKQRGRHEKTAAQNCAKRQNSAEGMRKLPRRTAPNAKTARKAWENCRAELRQTPKQRGKHEKTAVSNN